LIALSALIFLMVACGRQEPTLVGSWRAVLASPGGDLPFGLLIEGEPSAWRASIQNCDEKAPISRVIENDGSVTFFFDGYDSEIQARMTAKDRLEGSWRRTTSGPDSVLPFTATRGAASSDTVRFSNFVGANPSNVPTIAGDWAAEFVDEDGRSIAQAELRDHGDRVFGTFLTPTGDYRFLEGSYQAGTLRLSTFDGAHAFLFQAKALADGTLAGDFWSRDRYHATFTARRKVADEEVLPDAWSQIALKNPEGRLTFSFPDLEGRTVGIADERFRGKVLIVNIFGSWCPNCNDEAPLLADFHRRFAGQGLEIVGLAYEYTGKAERDRIQVKRFGERHGITYPLLLAGTSDKKAAAATLPELNAILAFPTTIFIGRDGRVRKIHSGYAGPATGDHHRLLVAELEATVQELLNET
jgi:thiol-disulfide isomerase/thioredoxin